MSTTNKDGTYNRYMIFTWSEYDNPSPFECVSGSAHFLVDAVKMYEEAYQAAEDGTPLVCIFDTQERQLIDVPMLRGKAS